MLKSIEYLVVHHSASPRSWDIERIRRVHVQDNGWASIGYHWVIEQDGTMKAGRPLWESGAHCPPWNQRSWGVCVIGDNTSADPRASNWRRDDHRWTEAQKATLRQLVASCRLMVPGIKIAGHREIGSTNTACPGLTPEQLRALLAA